MNSTKVLAAWRVCVWAISIGVCFLGGRLAVGQAIQHLSVPVEGGMPGTPLITGIESHSNKVLVTWDGPAGYYQLFQKVGSELQPVTARTNLSRRALVDATSSNAFFAIFGPAPSYAGDRACVECHEPVYNQVTQTPHAHALDVLKDVEQDQNPSCLPCHTVGYKLKTGFVSEATTPHLANAQCESCHGPAANHAANPDDLITRPRVEIASEACGGCHQGSMNPTFEEWKNTGHAIVTEDMNPASRISSCGRCHSGSARLSLMNGDPLPSGDANRPIECAVCHEPHHTTENPAQLKNPVYSTEDYWLSTADIFTNKYNPTINICGQCHNHRGASWTSTSRPPHHSPQYNMLIGTVGELTSGQPANSPADHAFLEKQCVTCHMQTRPFVSEEEPAETGHNFRVNSYDLCRDCHTDPEGLVEFVAASVSGQIDDVKAALDQWATTRAPQALRDKYGTLAWEYTNPGSLSSGGSGPTTAEQALIPDTIKKSRYNMYLVLYDGSYGVHNGPHAITLLTAARNWVQQALRE